MPNSTHRSPRTRHRRAAPPAEAAYRTHRADCPATAAADGSTWRPLSPADKAAQLFEWQIPAEHASGNYAVQATVSLFLQSGSGLMQWVDGERTPPTALHSALVPGDVLQLPPGAHFRFWARSTSAVVFFVTGHCAPVMAD